MKQEETIRQVEKLLEKAGTTVSLETGEAFPALILPQLPAQTPDGLRRVFGREETGRFTYYGPGRNGGQLVARGSALRQGDRTFRVVWIDDLTLGDRVLARWGELMAEEGENL